MAGGGTRPVPAAPPAHEAPATPLRVLYAPRNPPPLAPDVAGDLPRYRQWVRQREADRLAGRVADAPPRSPRTTGGRRPPAPELLLVTVVGDVEPEELEGCLASLAAQTSRHWCLSITATGALDTRTENALQRRLRALPGRHAELHRLAPGTGALDAVRHAVAASRSPAFALLDATDRLAPDAVALLAAGLADADVAYADEDRLDEDGEPADPVLKPDWSPELVLSSNYVGRPVAFRRTAVEAAGGLGDAAATDWEHDLVLRVSEETTVRIAHVAEVLCHRGARSVPARSGPGPVTAALDRRGEDATVEPGPVAGSWHVRRPLDHRPTVSAIVPFRDGPALLRACVDSVTATASDVDLHLVLVDNGSEDPETLTLLDRLADRPDVTVVADPRPFNWAALNNAAVAAGRGEVLLFVNNDIEARRTGWLGALAVQALRPVVGAVGARLVYPNGRVQHAGVVLGMAGAAGHVLNGLAGDEPGYLGMAVLARDCSAVTGACMATRAAVFDQLGGFDEELGLDCNDIDFCLRAQAAGLRIVYEPQAELVHHESPSRGTSGSAADQRHFLARWEDRVVAGDPFLNRHLSRVECSAELRGPDEGGWWSRWRANLTR